MNKYIVECYLNGSRMDNTFTEYSKAKKWFDTSCTHYDKVVLKWIKIDSVIQKVWIRDQDLIER
jgi:hypothetical protein